MTTVIPFSENMTIREYLEWATILPYSRELYDFQKESAELELLGLYIESNQYRLQHSEGPHLESLSCYSESMDIIMLEATGGFLEKIGSILRWIFKVLTAPFRVIGSLLNAIFGKKKKSEDTQKKADTVNQTLQNDQNFDKVKDKLPGMLEEYRKTMEQFYQQAQTMADPDDVSKLGDFEQEWKEIELGINQFKSNTNKAAFIELNNKIMKMGMDIESIPLPLVMGNISDLSKEITSYIGGLSADLEVRDRGGHATRPMNRGKDGVLKDTIASLLSASNQTVQIPFAAIPEKIKEMEQAEKTISAEIKRILDLIEQKKAEFDANAQGTTDAAAQSNWQAGAARIGTVSRELTVFSNSFNQLAKTTIETMTKKVQELTTAQEAVERLQTDFSTLIADSIEGFDAAMNDEDSILTLSADGARFVPKQKQTASSSPPPPNPYPPDEIEAARNRIQKIRDGIARMEKKGIHLNQHENFQKLKSAGEAKLQELEHAINVNNRSDQTVNSIDLLMDQLTALTTGFNHIANNQNPHVGWIHDAA